MGTEILHHEIEKEKEKEIPLCTSKKTLSLLQHMKDQTGRAKSWKAIQESTKA
jgi:hypothetical protein